MVRALMQWLKARKARIREVKQTRDVRRLEKLLAASGRFAKLTALSQDNARAIQELDHETRACVKTGVPKLIDLGNMRQSRPGDIASTELASAVANLEYLGTGVIIYYLDADQIRIGANTQLRDYSILEVGGTLNIGENCVIGAYNWFQSSGAITIGNGVIIGPHSAIVSTTHESPTPDNPVRFSPLQKGEVHIGDNTWIGAHVSILKGVRIGKNVTIGAGSVVMSDIPDNATAVGTPCRVIERTRDGARKGTSEKAGDIR